ncbi:MAG: hypothetical protein OXH70_02795 [Acidobacteria bacterium]|nr:hypothetical protein [Acidobacteriota bacterium]
MRTARAIRAIAVFAAVAFAAGPLWSQSVEERLQGFDEWVESVMTEWKVPGLGVAIVEDGKTVYARGYGWRANVVAVPLEPVILPIRFVRTTD